MSANDLLNEGVILIPFEEDGESIIAEESLNGPMARSEIDLPEGPLLRFKGYRKAWDECLERIKMILSKLQQPVVEEAVLCIYEPISHPDAAEFLLSSEEIKTVVISCPDRTFAHESLHLICTTFIIPETDNLPYAMISQIRDTDCTQLASMVKAMITGFQVDPIHENLKLKSSPDIQVLEFWIEEVKAKLGTMIMMIVILPDLGLIAASLLADFLDLCHCHIPQLPLTIITTASDTGYLNRTLPRSTLTKLRIENFSLPCDLPVVEHIIEETFFSPEFTPVLMIGPSSLEMIVSEYSQNNSTLDNLLSHIQVLYLQHFYNPLSLLCIRDLDTFLSFMLQDSENNPKWKTFMKHVRLKVLSQYMSKSEWSELSPSKVLEKAFEGRNSFHNRIRHMKIALRIWNVIQKFCRARGVKVMNARPLELGITALQNETGNSIADAVVSSLKSLDRIQTAALLEELLYYINNLPQTVRNLTTGVKVQIVHTMDQPDNLETLCEFLARYFRATLTSFDDIPLLDIWVINNDSLPNSPFNPNVHVSIVTALLEPKGYLDWGASYRRQDAQLLPDTSLAFQRYVDSGRMINLYDWYHTFTMSFERENVNGQDEDDLMDVEDTPSKSRNKQSSRLMTREIKPNKDRLVDKRELQARFMRTVHELEFVGFLRRTNRRAEHVVKTVFDIMD